MKIEPVYKTCPICSKVFRVKRTHAERRRYCSFRCRNQGQWGTDCQVPNLTCPICGKQLHIRPSLLARQKTCGAKECFRKWMSITHRGENGNNWKGGITQVLRYLRSCKPMRAWAETVLASTEGKCAHCGRPAEEAHHIEAVAELLARMLDPKNGIPLCYDCHNALPDHNHGRPARRPRKTQNSALP